MGMFDGRFKSRGHYDHRMDAGPIIPVKPVRRRDPREQKFNRDTGIYENSSNKYVNPFDVKEKVCNWLGIKGVPNEIEWWFIKYFIDTTIDDEDYIAWEEGTLSEEKVVEHQSKYLEAYNTSFEEYKAAYIEYFESLRSEQTNWQLGGSCFTDRYLDFQGEANEKEVRWGVFFSICASLLVSILLFYFSLFFPFLLIFLGSLAFSGIISVGYSSLLMRHINYKGWNKMSVLAPPIVLGILLLVILSNDLNMDSVQFEDLFYLLLRFMMFENIILIIYLLILSFIGINKSKH